jgi:mRNA-degrading endonuclease toxin of MazEF toxin-antitoxin module
MFEKPQYFTKDGFRRLSKNPHSDGGLQRQSALAKQIKSAAVARQVHKVTGISDEAARLIAGVLKGMLNNSGK